MDQEHYDALELVASAHHILWVEFETHIRHLFCDLVLEGLVDLSFHNDTPYVFVINDCGLAVLRHAEISYI